MKRTPDLTALHEDALGLLRQLISMPSFSREEHGTAAILRSAMKEYGIEAQTHLNNVWCRNRAYNPALPNLLLNSHHDTVRPNAGYTLNAFEPLEREGRLHGLGSNDAGASLVALLAAFRYFNERKDLRYNLVFAATAEEEISGPNGIESLLPVIGTIDCGIVGEPTGMRMAVAEKGLLVLDCIVRGTAGHAAREEGENAIYKALADIGWFRNYRFARESSLLGPVKLSVTLIGAGTQHNVVPDECRFTVDVRVNDCYTHEEILQEMRAHVGCEIHPRSLRLRATSIDLAHPIVRAGAAIGLESFGSSTLSDKALMPFPALKIGPGESGRSHTADEFVMLDELYAGIDTYIRLLTQILI